MTMLSARNGGRRLASADYADELYYREVARQELDKLNGGTGEIVNAVPLDALLNTMLGVE